VRSTDVAASVFVRQPWEQRALKKNVYCVRAALIFIFQKLFFGVEDASFHFIFSTFPSQKSKTR
jgi:hypothetical protein